MAGKKVNRLIVPNVYTANGVEPVTSVNNILPVNGNVTIPIPTVPTNVSAFTNDAGYLTSATLDGYATQSWVQQQGYLTSVPSQYITDTELSTTLADYAQTTDIPTVGNGTITINQGGVQKGTFTVNQSGNSTINLDAVGSVNSVNGQTGTVVLTASDVGALPDSTTIPSKTSDLTNDSGFITNSALSPYALSSSLATVATSGSYNDLSNKPTIPAAQIQSDWNQTDNSAVDFIKNKPTIPSGVVVDQTYDPLSVNAQSGVAIAGAGFLTSIPSGYLQNTATGSNSLTISGTATSNIRATNIGYGSIASDYAAALGNNAEASGYAATALGNNAEASAYATALGANATASNNATALGVGANADGYYAVTLGCNADASGNSAIQIGYGANSIANTLNIGFFNDAITHHNWRLLDGTTGLIPDARISTNIARASQIPTVPTNVSAFTNDSGYQTSGDVNTTVANAISTLLGNIYPVGSVYIGTQSTCPLETLISGSTWQLVAEDRVLQGSSTNHSANTTVAAGLPNITGSISSRGFTTQYSGAINSASGAFTYTRNGQSGTSTPVSVTGTAIKGDVTQFNASHSSSVYGNSTTVQPPAYVVNVWRRTA